MCFAYHNCDTSVLYTVLQSRFYASVLWTMCENQFRIAFGNDQEVTPSLKMYMSGLVLPMYLKLR